MAKTNFVKKVTTDIELYLKSLGNSSTTINNELHLQMLLAKYLATSNSGVPGLPEIK